MAKTENLEPRIKQTAIKRIGLVLSALSLLPQTALALSLIAIYLGQPSLLLLAAAPTGLHLWSGIFWCANRNNCNWTFNSIVLLMLAVIHFPIMAIVIYWNVDSAREITIVFELFSVGWTFCAWATGTMALVDEWI